MFSFLRKSPQGGDDQFMVDLATVAVDFNEISDHIDAGSATLLMSRAAAFHKERGKNEIGFTAADFYFYIFIDQMCLVTDHEAITPLQSARYWALTDSFLDGHHKYRTSVVTTCMNTWYEMLMRFGVV